MHLWSMYVLNRMQKKNNLMTKLTIVTSWKKTAQTMRETTRKSLLKHTLFGDFAKLISICIEFTILPGLPSTFKGFLSQSDFNSYSYQVSPSILSGFWADFSVLSVSLVLLFPTLCRIWGSVGVVPFLAEAFKVTGNSMTRHESSHRGHHAAPTWAVEAGSCWASNHAGEAHTHLIWRPSRAVLGWMGAHPRGTLMSVRTLHAETSHALRIVGCEGDLCCLE